MTTPWKFWCVATLATLTMLPGLRAQMVNRQQQLTLEGLRSANGHGSFAAAAYAPDGSLILLLDEHDGVRVLRADAAGQTVLAQTVVGATGDSGVALALDAAGDIYVTGTTTSSSLSGTSGVVYPARADTSTNSFLAKFDSSLNLNFLTFLGAGRTAATALAVTADAVFVTGYTFNAAFPVSAAGIQQTPATGSSENGFVERFNTAGTQMVYATYLTGANGNTVPAGLAADAADAAYIVGATTSSGLPTVAALVPQSLGTTSGFLTKLTAAGSGFVFATFLPGNGITGLALDAHSNSLLLTGNIALGQFPVATVSMPLASASYQSLLRIPVDGQSVTASVLLVPGTQSFVAAGTNGDAWVSGSLTTPLFPGAAQPDYTAGDSFVLHLTATSVIDQTLRLGGMPVNGIAHSSLSSVLAAPAVAASGTSVMLPGMVTASVAASLLASQRFDLPFADAPGSTSNALLPNGVHDLLPTAANCSGSVCSGTGAFLASFSTAASAPALTLSTDDLPNLTLRNAGSASATGLALTASGYSLTSNCGTSLAPSNGCSIALTGTGPGSLTASAANGATATATLGTSTAAPDSVVLSTDELDFGIISPSATRSLTVSNLGSAAATFSASLDGATSSAYQLTTTATTCSAGTTAGSYALAAGASCQLTFTLAIQAGSTDGPVHTSWLIGQRDVTVTGYLESSPLSLSAGEIDFGAQLPGTAAIHLPRFLYLSNNGSSAIAHAMAAVPSGSPFTVSDGCPTSLEPKTVCSLQIGYLSPAAPSSDAAVLTLDGGMTVALTGRTLAPAAANGNVANPSLSVSTSAVNFTTPVVVSGIASTVQTVMLQNTGSTSITLALAITGDFTLSNGCPSSLSAGVTCSLVIGFSPSSPGLRDGLLSIATGNGFTPSLVSLSGTGAALLPANNGSLDLGQSLVGEPVVAWYKVQQALPNLTIASTSPSFGVALVNETGNGHGTLPAGAFAQSTTGSCANCWLGVQFLGQTAGAQAATLAITTTQGGNPYQVGVTAVAIAVQGLLLTPLNQDFGPVAINSSTQPVLFTLANLLAGSAGATVQAVQATGDFSIANNTSGGPGCSGTLFATASCFIQVMFSPTATGQRSGVLTVTTSAGSVSVPLTGYGEPDPGVALNPTSLTFQNEPGSAATTQSVTVSNTGSSMLTIGAVAATDPSFALSSNCGNLAPGALCTVAVTFTPQTAQTTASLTVPVTMTVNGQTSTTTYSVSLQGGYTTTDAGLQIIADEADFGATATATVGETLEFTLNNLSGKAVAVSFQMPRQFVLATASPCASLAAGGSCTFSASFAPETSGFATGSVTAVGVAADGTVVQSLGYLLGYGTGNGRLAITGYPIPYSPVGFGQVTSGQSATETLTLTNSGTTPLTLHRISSEPPFYATTNCGQTMAPGANCAVTLRYAPVYEVSSGSSALARNDVGYLTLESDAASSPDIVDLTGAAAPVTVAAPGNGSSLASYQLSNSALTFANTAVGNISPAQTVTLINSGTTTLHITAVQAPVDFQASTNCGTQLPGSICTLSVSLAPTVASTATVRGGAVALLSDATDALEYISVIGISSNAPLTMNPTSLNFGTLSLGATSTQQVSVTNTTSAPATFQGLTTTGDYSVATGNCPATGNTLPAGASCTLTVTFTPTATGTRNGMLSLASDATQVPLTVALTGIAVQTHLSVSATVLAFGNVTVGTTGSLNLLVTNTGSAAINGVASSITGTNASAFAVSVPCSTTSLAPGASCLLTVTFTPSLTGSDAATLSIASSDPQGPAVVALTGAGVAGASFVLTVNGGSSATMTVTHGSAAVYPLLLTPQNGFAGAIALTCTPIVAAQYAACSLLNSTMTLGATAQSSTATISTIVSAQSMAGGIMAGLLLAPLALLLRKRMPRLAALLLLVAVGCGATALTGCGSGSMGSGSSGPSTLTTPPGTYQYVVTASSTSGAVLSSSVTLNLIVQ